MIFDKVAIFARQQPLFFDVLLWIVIMGFVLTNAYFILPLLWYTLPVVILSSAAITTLMCVIHNKIHPAAQGTK